MTQEERELEQAKELTERIAYKISEELEETRDLGPALHMMAIKNVILSLMFFFNRFTDEDVTEFFLDKIKEEYRDLNLTMGKIQAVDHSMYN